MVNMKTIIVKLLLISLLICGTITLADDKAKPFDFEKFKEGFKKGDKKAWEEAATNLEKHRKDIIEFLMSIVADEGEAEKNPEKVDRAIRLLGTLRAEEAIDLLISKIGFTAVPEEEGPYSFKPGPSIELAFPSIVALTKIGVPATQPIITAIANGKMKEAGFGKGVSVLRRIYGRELTILILEKKAKEETDANKKTNIEKALKSFEEKERNKVREEWLK